MRTVSSSLFVGEVFRTPWLSRFTLSEVSQLDCDISTVHRAVREWKNSFARVNCIPLEILSFISTYLSYHRDILSASSVCRHWRGVLLQHGALWTQLFLRRGEDYVRTLLERAKGSALEISTDSRVSLSTIALLSPHAQQIKKLEFQNNSWTDILTFSEFTSGSLPLLRNLKIRNTQRDLPDRHSILPLFSGATNLEEFTLQPGWVRLLDSFVFPNLNTFKLWTSQSDCFDPSHLFGFLEASPMLQTVELHIHRGIMSGTIPQEAVVVLPNVETFSLMEGEHYLHPYGLATHISCPRAKHTSFEWFTCEDDVTSDLELFPSSIFWEMVTRNYTTSQVEGVTLEIKYNDSFLTHSLTFQSSDATVIKLGVCVFDTKAEGGGSDLSYEGVRFKLFSQACQTIQGHPLLSHIKRLHIKGRAGISCANYLQRTAAVVVELLGSLGPLDKLTIYGCDPEIFLIPYMGSENWFQLGQVFPPVKELAISNVFISTKHCIDGLVQLAKEQHKQGKPFKCLTVHTWEFTVPMTVTERLREWIGAVYCYQMTYWGGVLSV